MTLPTAEEPEESGATAKAALAFGGSERLSERTLSGFGWTSLIMGAQALLQIVAIILLARLLTPSDFGLFAAAMVVGGFCTIFSELGISPAIVQRLELEPRHVRTGFTLSILLSLAAAVAVWMSADLIAGFFGMPPLADVVRLMTFGFPLQGISSVAQSMVLRGFRFRWLAKVEATSFAVGFVIVAPVLTFFDFGVMALVGAYLTQQSLRCMFLLRGQSHDKRPMLEWRAAGELLYFGSGFSIAKFFNYFATQADNMVVGRWLGAAALGIYGHAYQLMASPAMLIGQALDRVLFPAMASVQHQKERLARAYRTGVYACAMIVLPSSALIAILAPELVLFLLGSQWAEVTVPLRILACAMLFRTSYKISDSIVRATGAVYARAARQVVFAAAVLAGALIGQNFGLAGVAWGVFTALALNFLIMAQLSLKLCNMSWRTFFAAHAPGATLGAAVAVASLTAATALRAADFGHLTVILFVLLIALTVGVTLLTVWPKVLIGRDNLTLLSVLSNVGPSRLQRLIRFIQKKVSV